MPHARCLILLLLSSVAWTAPPWRGDFETGDLSQWGQQQRVSPDSLRVVRSPTWEGQWALAATVSQGDDPLGASGNRAELVRGAFEEDGSERWYRWAVLFPPDFPASNRWQLFTQWHHDGCCGSPPVEFHVTSERLTLNVLSQSRWSQPLERGRWYEFLFHVRWSSDPGMGFAELWVDGQAALQRTALATAFPGMRNYLKVGYYRDASIPGTGTVYVDGMVSGPTRADVLPAPASQAADSGAPATAAPPPVPTSPGPVLTAGPETRAASSAPPPPSGCAAAPAGMVALAWALRRRRHVTGL